MDIIIEINFFLLNFFLLNLYLHYIITFTKIYIKNYKKIYYSSSSILLILLRFL